MDLRESYVWRSSGEVPSAVYGRKLGRISYDQYRLAKAQYILSQFLVYHRTLV
jgi:hypothetical protein